MKITMNDENIVSIAQLKSFLKEAVQSVSFSINNIGNKNKQEMYDWVGTIISRFRYFSLKKKERGIVLSYIEKITKRSRGQIKKWIKKKKKFGRIKLSSIKKNIFRTRYGTSDIARLIETDNVHGRLSGPATKKILLREYLTYNKLGYARISHISVLISTTLERVPDSIDLTSCSLLKHRQCRETSENAENRSLSVNQAI